MQTGYKHAAKYGHLEFNALHGKTDKIEDLKKYIRLWKTY